MVRDAYLSMRWKGSGWTQLSGNYDIFVATDGTEVRVDSTGLRMGDAQKKAYEIWKAGKRG